MDQNVKNRLVGLIVMFALAVIFLPMLLDGSGAEQAEFEMIVPPKPIVEANPDFTRKQLELSRKVEELPNLQSRLIDQSLELSEAEAGDELVQTKVSEKEAAAKLAEEQIAKNKAMLKNATKKTANKKVGGDSWVLQVGSFKDRSKAEKQRDKLRKSNIAAVFIEKFLVGGSNSYRVRLGPFSNRDQTKVARNKIKAKHDIDGLIMKYER